MQPAQADCRLSVVPKLIQDMAQTVSLPNGQDFDIMIANVSQGYKLSAPRLERQHRMADLLRRIAENGDVEAFQHLYQSFGPRVKSYMMRQGADADTAEELAQETLLTVWRKAPLYAPEKGSASTWIYTIARNLRIDRLRREFPWQELPEGHNETPSSDTPPDEMVSENERQARVQQSLKNLPADQYEVVALSYLEGLSHSEIADKLNVPLGTVKSRMRLAYQKIRETVEDLK
jgi:RNA polymerase sigma-70 factor, ECF subfamily